MGLSAQQRRSMMPSAQKIHEYWTLERGREAAEWFDQIDPGEPSCYACGWYPIYSGSFKGYHRSHLVDHAHGGSVEASNLILLCPTCNTSMPMFPPGQEADAVDWVRYHFPWSVIGAAKAQDVCRYVYDKGDLPPWFRRLMAELPVQARGDLTTTLAEVLAHRASETGELFPAESA